jgi:hypothetical protein
MIRNNDFILREVAGTRVLVPVGEATKNFPGMDTANATSAFLWEQLETTQTAESLALALTERYDVSREKATADVAKFLEVLLQIGAVAE